MFNVTWICLTFGLFDFRVNYYAQTDLIITLIYRESYSKSVLSRYIDVILRKVCAAPHEGEHK